MKSPMHLAKVFDLSHRKQVSDGDLKTTIVLIICDLERLNLQWLTYHTV